MVALRPSAAVTAALALASVLGAAGIAGCPPAGAVCRSSADCQASEICVESSCHLACNATPDCPPAEVCRNGICFEAGASDVAIADVGAVDTIPLDASRPDAASLDGTVARDTAPLVDARLPDSARDVGALDRVDAGTGADHTVAVDTAVIILDAATPVDATAQERPDAGAQCPGAPLLDICPPGNPDLAACFTFDNDNGATAPPLIADSSDYFNHGSIAVLDHQSGIDGLALTLDGVHEVLVPTSSSLNPTSAFTLEAWVLLDQLPVSGTRVGIIDKHAQYGLFVYANGQARCTASSTSVALYGGSIVAGRWSHLACAYAPALGIYRMYQDGVEVAQLATSLAIPAGSEVLALGGNSPSGEVMTGALDNVRIWRTVRSASDICWAAQR